jgi:ribose 5-phosphate isomerase A
LPWTALVLPVFELEISTDFDFLICESAAARTGMEIPLRSGYDVAPAKGLTERMENSKRMAWKKAAGEAAAALVKDGMVVGLGTGSTASFVVAALALRIAREKLKMVGIATSEQTALQARSLDVPLTSFAEHTTIDLTLDGADEVERGTLFLIKGGGGALLREKIVAGASREMVVVADQTKLVERLGSVFAVPVEVVPFGWQATEKKLKDLGGNPSLRIDADKKPFVTDGGHYIIDCAFGPMEKPKETAHHLDHVTGVVEHGLFLGFASRVLIAGPEGVEILNP